MAKISDVGGDQAERESNEKRGGKRRGGRERNFEVLDPRNVWDRLALMMTAHDTADVSACLLVEQVRLALRLERVQREFGRA